MLAFFCTFDILVKENDLLFSIQNKNNEHLINYNNYIDLK